MRRFISFTGFAILCLIVTLSGCTKNSEKPGAASNSLLQLQRVRVGSKIIYLDKTNENIPVDKNIFIEFSAMLDTASVRKNISLLDENNLPVQTEINYLDNYQTIVIIPADSLNYMAGYTIRIDSNIKGFGQEDFPGIAYQFTTVNGTMAIKSITLNGIALTANKVLQQINTKKIDFEITFSQALDPLNVAGNFTLSGNVPLNASLSDDHKTITVSNNSELRGLTHYYFSISRNLTASNGFIFDGYSTSFYTGIDSTLKYPEISDDELLTLIEKQTFRYFWDFAHPSSGMARERNTSGDIVTTGGSGFGVMALIVGMDRGFITRNQGLTRLDKILNFLETCDRFHGAWPHWLNGSTGKTIPFGTQDNGADLVETSYMVEGLLTMRQYLNATDAGEKNLIDRINALCDSVDYNWFTRGEDVLYWHWSPDYGWAMNMKIQGYNETLITYVVAASSRTHPISAAAYTKGYAKNGAIVNGNIYYGYTLPLGPAYGGPLFFTHYSFLGLDPRNLSDQYADYWKQNVNQSLINHAYCVDNPHNYVGYGPHSWGLTASDNPWGYNAHSPTNDLGVISPTAAISAIAYTPEQSMDAIRHFYYYLGDRLWGEYGFYDAFDPTEVWWADSYLAIDQGPIICMIENHRTALLWNLFMSCPEIQKGLDTLGFNY